ncbi:dynein axonemal assembly factor 6 [Cylas formicarius]|uniref:dynein axonemal assembly factor 6 n=1 Tax=Cylas formicarius TaxID=197179 RepID=UPI002958C133|nr:dynein axonemal assembly factor 6 [Cylas formicarius]
MESSVCEIQKLVELFNAGSGEHDETEGRDVEDGRSSITGGDKHIDLNHVKNPYTKLEPQKTTAMEDEEAEVSFEESKWKVTPSWDVSYKQSVTTNDVFLGMGFKTPSTSSCEAMVVTVDLPGQRGPNIDLKIFKDRLRLSSPKFFLDVALPHPVDPKMGNAEFDAESQKLKVNLVMRRELDAVNF